MTTNVIPIRVKMAADVLMDVVITVTLVTAASVPETILENIVRDVSVTIATTEEHCERRK